MQTMSTAVTAYVQLSGSELMKLTDVKTGFAQHMSLVYLYNIGLVVMLAVLNRLSLINKYL